MPSPLMQSAALSLTVAATVAVGIAFADPLPSLPEIPVADMQVVAPKEYSAALSLAANGGSPVDIAVKIAGEFEGTMQHIVQVNAGAESPRATRITMFRDGFLDDATRGDRWEVDLERSVNGVWSIREVKRAWRCRRGERADQYATALCL